jgi:hypothetical protein
MVDLVDLFCRESAVVGIPRAVVEDNIERRQAEDDERLNAVQSAPAASNPVGVVEAILEFVSDDRAVDRLRDQSVSVEDLLLVPHSQVLVNPLS